MFILDKSKFGDLDLTNAKEFVEFWREYYPVDNVTILGREDKISYINELNLNNDLTKENVKRLLRWKYPRWLTEKKSSGEDNKTVKKVVDTLESINDFRHNRIDKDEFSEIVGKIFSEGLIYRVFLFHIARPYKYPIADKYVFRTFTTLKKQKEPNDCNSYKKYREFFFDTAKSAEILIQEPKGNETDIADIVSRLKEVDNALFAYGQFLESYYKK